MKTNDTFSIARAAAYARLVMITNRKTLLVTLAALFGVMLFIVVVSPLINHVYTIEQYDYSEDPFWDNEYTSFSMIFLWFMAYTGAMFYLGAQGKDKRILTFMVPASNLEKFASLFVIYTVLPVVAFIVLSFAADYIRVFIASLYAAEDIMVAPISLSYIINFGTDDYLKSEDIVMLRVMYLSCVAFATSFFTLGSIVWYKRTFQKSVVFGIVLFVVLFVLFIWGVDVFAENFRSIDRRLDIVVGQSNFAILTGCLTATFAMLFYWISYIRFKESEIVNRW